LNNRHIVAKAWQADATVSEKTKMSGMVGVGVLPAANRAFSPAERTLDNQNARNGSGGNMPPDTVGRMPAHIFRNT